MRSAPAAADNRRVDELDHRRNMRPQEPATRGTLAVICLSTAMLMLDIAVVNTALAQIARDLDSGLSGVQWVIDAYTIALATVVLSAGSLADRLGRRRIFAWGMGLFTSTSIVCSLATSIGVLDGARALQGIGAAMMFATSLAILADAFPQQPRARIGTACDLKDGVGSLGWFAAGGGGHR